VEVMLEVLPHPSLFLSHTHIHTQTNRLSTLTLPSPGPNLFLT
jgi:hypothetical protein